MGVLSQQWEVGGIATKKWFVAVINLTMRFLRPLELVCGMNVEEFGTPEGANSLERETA